MDDVSSVCVYQQLLSAWYHHLTALLRLRSFDALLMCSINGYPAEVLSVIFSMASFTPFHPDFPRCPEEVYQSPRILHTQIMQVCQH